MMIKNKLLKKYIFFILKLVFLTNILCILLFWKNFHVWLGFLLGSLAGSLNLFLQAKGTENHMELTPGHAKKNVFKNFYVRYIILFVLLVLFIKFLPVNLIALLVGVISIQVIILANGLISGLIKKK